VSKHRLSDATLAVPTAQFEQDARYHAFLTSPRWKIRRAQFYATHSRACSACHSRTKVDLHHKTYERRGYEADQDLVALCHDCHSAVHRAGSLSGMVITRNDKTDSLHICNTSRRNNPIPDQIGTATCSDWRPSKPPVRHVNKGERLGAYSLIDAYIKKLAQRQTQRDATTTGRIWSPTDVRNALGIRGKP